MKRILSSLLLMGSLLSVAGGAEQLTNFSLLLKNLKQGETVRAVFFYARCRLIRDNEEVNSVPDAIGGMNLETFEYFAPGVVGNQLGYIAFSHEVLISHPRYGYVLNYVKVRVFADGRVRIIARYLDPRSHEVRMNESFYTQVDKGDHTAGAEFFRVP